MACKTLIPLITASDIGNVKQFYVTHLGFKTTFENDTFIELKQVDSPALTLCFMSPQEGETASKPNCTLCMEVDDVDKEHDRLAGIDIPIVQPLKDYPWGDRSFMIADPEGTVLYLYHPIEPAPEFKAYFKE